jgi:FkbM family methyltransferase
VALRATRRIGRLLCTAGERIARNGGIKGTWIDVGAHHGEETLQQAIQNPALSIYALEPNLAAAAKLIGKASNYFVVPMAVAETNGVADFRLNRFDAASSLLPFNETALRTWVGGDVLQVESVVTVPTIRLDTLMDLLNIEKVDFLKIDTQGMDLAVLKSSGNKLRMVSKVRLEVDVTPSPLYSGAPSKDQIVAFLAQAGFSLTGVEEQTHGQEENLTFVRID